MSAKWEGQDALLMGRIYSFGFADQPPVFKAWYMSLARWLGRHFQSVSAAALRAAIGPAAHEWLRRGGVLLPGFLRPVTPAWKDVVRHQESLRVTTRRTALYFLTLCAGTMPGVFSWIV